MIVPTEAQLKAVKGSISDAAVAGGCYCSGPPGGTCICQRRNPKDVFAKIVNESRGQK